VKRVLIPALSAVLLAFFSIPVLAGSPGGGQGGPPGGGSGGGLAAGLGAYCQGSASNGSAFPGGTENCVISVQFGRLPVNSNVTLNLVYPASLGVFCAGALAVATTGCVFPLPNGASQGAQIGRLDFRVSGIVQTPAPVILSATVCGSPCSSIQVAVTGPGATITAGPPPPPPPPTFPFATGYCTGQNGDGSASAGQLDTCSVSAASGNSYGAGESVKVRPTAPSGTVVAACQGLNASSYQTSGMIDGAGFCRLSVVSGRVHSPDVMGTETVQLAADAAAGTQLQQFVNWCSAPGPDGEGICKAGPGLMPTTGPGASVSPDPPVIASGVSVNSTEGLAFSGTVATFTDGDPAGTFSQYAATIDWGDGSQSTDGVTGANAAADAFDVTGSHVYAEEGSYTITVSVSDIDTALFNTTTATSTAVIADAPLTAVGRDANNLNPFSGTLASFSDGNPKATLSDYTTSIYWGDQSSSSGAVTANGSAFDVSASHMYASLGPYTLIVQICDVGGSCATATSHLLVYALSQGGNFIIGDGSASSGTTVTFWGAQWATANTLSGAPSPDAFKGFADAPASAPSCGTAWATGPGNSARPPVTIPSYMAVTVATTVSTDGSKISGDSVHVVVVKTDPGFAADPGHAGTGTVAAQLC